MMLAWGLWGGVALAGGTAALLVIALVLPRGRRHLRRLDGLLDAWIEPILTPSVSLLVRALLLPLVVYAVPWPCLLLVELCFAALGVSEDVAVAAMLTIGLACGFLAPGLSIWFGVRAGVRAREDGDRLVGVLAAVVVGFALFGLGAWGWMLMA